MNWFELYAMFSAFDMVLRFAIWSLTFFECSFDIILICSLDSLHHTDRPQKETGYVSLWSINK